MDRLSPSPAPGMPDTMFPAWLFDGGDIEAAFTVARRAHAGQTDKQGVDYIWHPVTVAGLVRAAGGSADQIAAALLHDVVEDTDVTLDDLLDAGFTPTTVGIVAAVSRTPGVPYAQFIAVIEGDAVLVKLADLTHNTDPERALRDPVTGQALPPQQRYVDALRTLEAKLLAAAPRPDWLRSGHPHRGVSHGGHG